MKSEREVKSMDGPPVHRAILKPIKKKDKRRKPLQEAE